MENKLVNIKNRSDSKVAYTLPDTGVSRTWAPGEVKRNISVSELEQVTYIPGGTVLIKDYLLISDKDVCEDLGIETEPEYFYGEKEVEILLTSGSYEQFLDCLDFAPEGVIDLIKSMAVKLRLNDVRKREALKSRTGLDVTSAIANEEFANSKDEDNATNAATTKKRRASAVSEEKPKAAPKRRAAKVE